jgi:DNA polymerase elongation subunit (family B)
MKDVIITGQTQKLYARFIRTGEAMGRRFHKKSTNEEFKLQGAFVGEPVRGRHMNVLTNDFKSMYPTAMMAYNICPSTRISAPAPDMVEGVDYVKMEIPAEVNGVELPAHYEEYEGPGMKAFDPTRINDKEYMQQVVEANAVPDKYRQAFINNIREDYDLPPEGTFITRVIYFATKNVRQGTLPKMMEVLGAERTRCKNLMKEAEKRAKKAENEMKEKEMKDALIERDIYNARQELVKVVMNSGYGCLGTLHGDLSFPDCSMAITFVGRREIKRVNEFMRNKGCQIVYNDTDSIMYKLPFALYPKEATFGDVCDPDLVTIGKRLASEINNTILTAPMEMEFESVRGMVLLKKKKYIGYEMWKDGKTDLTPFSKGVAAVRGDTTPFVRLLYSDIVGMIMKNASFQEVYGECMKRLAGLSRGVYWIDGSERHIPNELLSVSKMLANAYKSSSAPMKVYSDYLKSIGENVNAGTRLSLIIIAPKYDSVGRLIKGKTSERYRPPETTETIDYAYYVKAAITPLQQLLIGAFPDNEEEITFEIGVEYDEEEE